MENDPKTGQGDIHNKAVSVRSFEKCRDHVETVHIWANRPNLNFANVLGEKLSCMTKGGLTRVKMFQNNINATHLIISNVF